MIQQLKSFSINNFKVFSEETTFDFASLTILTGTNSSGKSSLTKALALLAKSYQISGLRKLNLLEADLKTGGFNSILNTSATSDVITFGLLLSPSELLLKLFFRSEKLSSFQIFQNEELVLSTEFIKLPIEIIYKRKLAALCDGLADDEAERMFDQILDYLQRNPWSSFHGYYAINQEDIFDEIFNKGIEGLKEINFVNNVLLEYGEEVSHTANPFLLDIIPNQTVQFGLEDLKLAEFLDLSVLEGYDNPFKDIFSNFFNQFVFIPGVRASQEILYTSLNAPVLFKQLQKYIDNYAVHNKTYYALRKWLVDEFKIMDLEDDTIFSSVFKITAIEDLGYTIQLHVNNQWIHLANLGYGVTQFLPIMLNVLLSEDAKVYIIEEPESNLHPALQSKLADFFFEAVNIKKLFQKENNPFVEIGNNQFIIETHSEYLVRKLQYLTATPNSELKPEDTTIYYFYHPKAFPGYPQIQKIEILKEGSLSHDFGSGFFDEADNIGIDIWKLNNSQKN